LKNLHDSGYIIQHIRFENTNYDTEGDKEGTTLAEEYWECWEVTAGVVYLPAWKGKPKTASTGDTFDTATVDLASKQGYRVIKGRVNFFKDYHFLASDWDGHSGTCLELPNKATAPPHWSDVGAIDHTLTYKWVGSRVTDIAAGMGLAKGHEAVSSVP